MPAADYRQRIYEHYVKSHPALAGQRTLADLEPRRPYLEKLIREHFPAERGATIIDTGSGHGALLHFARAAGYANMIGVDGSPQQVALAAQLGIEGVREGDVMETLRALADESQDAVVSFDVIEHFTKEEAVAFVDEVLRVLAPGGRWIVHTCNGEPPFFGESRHGDFTHEVTYTNASMQQLLIASGFRQVRGFEDQPVPHGVRSAVRWFLWKLFRAVMRLYIAAETGDTGRGAILSRNFLAVALK